MAALRHIVKCVCGHLASGHHSGVSECWGTNCLCPEYRPNALSVARWKVIRRTCGICKRGFPDNTRSSICQPCLHEALTS